MSGLVEYATLDDLKAYMGVEELPKNASILLERASELVNFAIRGNYDSEKEYHKQAVKLAVCAQCQNWIETKVSAVSNGNISSYSLDGLSITFSDVDKFGNKLCVTSCRYLNKYHLMYRGLGV